MLNNRIGEMSYNKNNAKMTIVEYKNYNKIKVKFDTGNVVNTSYGSFLKGKVLNTFDREVYGIGYLGEGKYKPSINWKAISSYNTWRSMLQRCYVNKQTQEKRYPQYIGCTVDVEWHNFQNFSEWYYNNVYEIENDNIDIDKDILIKHNKIYSFNSCLLMPHRLNMLCVNAKKIRGKQPIGVCYDKTRDKYIAIMSKYNRNCFLGRYKTSEEAFYVYKEHKEKFIKQIADEYKVKINDKRFDKVHEALYNYKIEITD